jgi:hypothetical protein
VIKSGYAKADLQDALENLIMRDIILPIDGRFLSLALEGTPAALPLMNTFPGGGLKWEEEIPHSQISPPQRGFEL